MSKDSRAIYYHNNKKKKNKRFQKKSCKSYQHLSVKENNKKQYGCKR